MESNKKIAVIGSSSMVGSRFCELFSDSKLLIKADLQGENPIDITDKNSTNSFFKNNDFQTAILFSAFTDVDAAEKQRNDKEGICWKINVHGLENIVEKCKANGIKLVFISTSFVFDGQNGPYSEDSIPGGEMSKISWYGITKIEGEKIVRYLENSITLRIAYPYRANFPQKEDFARQIITKHKEGNLYPMFTDQIFSPTFADDLSGAIETLLGIGSSGVFNLASPKTTTPYDFACFLLDVFGEDTSTVKRGSLKEFMDTRDKTPRPMNSAITCQKIENLGFLPTTWQAGIKKMHEQFKGN